MNERRENTLVFFKQLVLLERYLQPYKFMVCPICLLYAYTGINVRMRTYLWKRIIQGTFGQNLVKIDKMVSEICVIFNKLLVGDGDDPGHLFTLIINIYGLGVGISTIKKFTLGRGWGMSLQWFY